MAFPLGVRIEALGRPAVRKIEQILGCASMAYLAVRYALRERVQSYGTIFKVFLSQVYFTGWQAMPLVTALAVATGAMIVFNYTAQVSLLGNPNLTGKILLVIVVREVGPLLTALVVIARSGSAVATELGNMRVNGEIDALKVMGINPLSYLVFPRLIGGVVSLLCLSFSYIVIAILGGYGVTRILQEIGFRFFIDSLIQVLTLSDVILFFVKNTGNGLFIFAICSYQGLQVRQSPHEVPQVTTKAVVGSILTVTGFSFVLSLVTYLGEYLGWGLM